MRSGTTLSICRPAIEYWVRRHYSLPLRLCSGIGLISGVIAIDNAFGAYADFAVANAFDVGNGFLLWMMTIVTMPLV
jgi:hypothetical protein